MHNNYNWTFDGFGTMGALEVHAAGTGVQRLERRPAWPSSGFDLNLSVIYWRAVGTWFEARGDHAPEGATFEGSHDLDATWNDAINCV